MKKQAFTTIPIVMFILLVSASTTRAQSVNQQLVADIPFSFTVANETMPAGRYTVAVVNPSSDQKVIRISSLHGTRSVMLRMAPVVASVKSNTKLVFRRYGEHHFLAQAWTSGDGYGLEASASRTERSVAKDLATVGRQMETLALKRR